MAGVTLTSRAAKERRETGSRGGADSAGGVGGAEEKRHRGRSRDRRRRSPRREEPRPAKGDELAKLFGTTKAERLREKGGREAKGGTAAQAERPRKKCAERPRKKCAERSRKSSAPAKQIFPERGNV